MRPLVLLTLVAALVWPGSICVLDLDAEGYILIEETTGTVLYEHNSDRWLFPASTTKIMTAMLLLEHCPVDEIVEVGEEITCIGPDSSTARLEVGDRLTVADLVYAMMLPSGNDAAYTAAVHVARRVSGFAQMDSEAAVTLFAEMMNDRAAALGAQDTNFVNPDGYHHPQHYSSARDLALIAREAMQNEFLRQVAATREYIWEWGERRQVWRNNNILLDPAYPQYYYPYAYGLKSGTTPEAGRCLVSAAEQDRLRLIAVVLNSSREGRWLDSRALLEYGFARYRYYQVYVPGRHVVTVPVTGQARGEPDTVALLAGDRLEGVFAVGDIARLSLDIRWLDNVLVRRRSGVVLRAPLARGQVVGRVVVSLDGEELGQVDIYAAANIRGSLWQLWLPGTMLAMVMVLLVLIVWWSQRSTPVLEER